MQIILVFKLLNEILSTNVLIPAINLGCSVQVTYKIIFALHLALVKKVRSKIFSSTTEKPIFWDSKSLLQKRDSKMKILLYDFGRRSQGLHQKTLFAISNRSLIDDQQILYNFKKWLQPQNSVPLLNYVHAFEDFNRRFFAKAELNEAEIDSFHRELSQIIDDYFSPNSKGKIPVKSKINIG